MDPTMFKRPLALLLGLLLCAAVGCAGSRDQSSFWPWQEKKKGPPGMVSPTEQLAMLHELAQKSESRTAQQKQQVAGLLLSMLAKEQDPLLRAEIVRTLRKFPTPESLVAVQGALKDSEADVRVAACEALGRMGGPQAVGGLSEALRGDVDVDVRMAAARALGETRDPASLVALGSALDDKDPAMQYQAVASLKNVTGKDLGNDVRRWQQFVKGELPEPAPPVSIAERMRHMLW
jgi:HEAT repeat protein